MMIQEQETVAALGELGENLKELQGMDTNTFLTMVKGWLPGLISFGIRIFIAVLIFFVGRKIIKLLQRMIGRSFERAGMEISVKKFLHSLIEFSLNGILIFVIAGQIGVDSASIVAILGSAGLALGLALQGSLANFAGSILILLMKPFKVGDYIIAPQAEGTVSVIGLVYTTLLTIDNKSITVPNGILSNSTVTNVTAMDKRRLDLTVGIGYQADLKKAKQVLERIYREHPKIRSEEDLSVYVDRLTEHSVVIGARGWVAADDYWTTKWDITEAIKLEFDKEEIQIPFNQMDVHIVP
ncbi:MAG: mechanosensitive ion channel [Clostridium sp.]